jgi:arsenate reductase
MVGSLPVPRPLHNCKSNEVCVWGISVNILFLCIENSARSQMAEGLARDIFGDSALIQSAGVNSSRVHPLAIEVMKEIGIDLSHQWSKTIQEIDLSQVDWIITLCDEEICTYSRLGLHKENWPCPNPTRGVFTANAQLDRFRDIRDFLRKKISELKKKISYDPKS